jgi:hypothetical protein
MWHLESEASGRIKKVYPTKYCRPLEHRLRCVTIIYAEKKGKC